jgi:hypothetical protein
MDKVSTSVDANEAVSSGLLLTDTVESQFEDDDGTQSASPQLILTKITVERRLSPASFALKPIFFDFGNQRS